MTEGQFVWEVNDKLIIDLALIDKRAWSILKKNVNHLVKTNQVEDIGMAYIAAFFVYVQQLVVMNDHDSSKDKIM